MGEFLSYSICGGLLMLSLYLAYRLFLARDNQHAFNRGVLLSIYIVSFAASPFMLSWDGLALTGSTVPAAVTPSDIVAEAMAPTAPAPVWATLLIWIFMAGMAVVAIKTLITWIRLTEIIRRGDRIACKGYVLVLTDDERFAPFSWMRYIVISRADYGGPGPAILDHELKHVACRHWIDLLVAQAVCIINWFNPAAWLMRDELMLVHEYQADMAVIDNGHDTREYQMMLIKKAVGARFPSLANSLNHSKLKKRITMMYKEKSSAGQKMKALALVPMLALALGVASVPAVRAAVTTIGNTALSVTDGKVSENKLNGKIAGVYRVTNLSNDGATTTAVIKCQGMEGCMTVSGGTFTTGGKTYHANSQSFDMAGGNGTITLSFPFAEEYKNASMIITVNGVDIPFDLSEFAHSSAPAAVGGTGISDSGKRHGASASKSKSSIIGNMAVIVNGESVDKADLDKIPVDDVLEITVDKGTNTLRIKTKTK